MASNYTENYQLCQWEATDAVQRLEFNADNAKIDAALAQKGNCQFYAATYTGSGTVSRSYTYPQKPDLVIVGGGNGAVIVMYYGFGSSASLSAFQQAVIQVQWDNNTVTWQHSGQNVSYACNTEGSTYYIFAITSIV